MPGHVVTAENQSIVFVSLVDDVPLMRGWHVMFKMVLQHSICKWWMQWYAFLPNPRPYVKYYNEDWLKGIATNSTPPHWTKSPICCSHGYLWRNLNWRKLKMDLSTNSLETSFFYLISTHIKSGQTAIFMQNCSRYILASLFFFSTKSLQSDYIFSLIFRGTAWLSGTNGKGV